MRRRRGDARRDFRTYIILIVASFTDANAAGAIQTAPRVALLFSAHTHTRTHSEAGRQETGPKEVTEGKCHPEKRLRLIAPGLISG